MSKIQAVDESFFWGIVQSVNWANDFNYNRIRVDLMKLLTPQAQDDFELIFYKKTDDLANAIDKYCEDKGTSTGCGDDSFNDLIAHIVGLGRNEYDKTMNNPALAIRRALTGQYKESFSYAIPNKKHRKYISKEKYTTQAKKYLEEEEGLVNFLRLPDNKQEALSVLNDVDVKKNVMILVSRLEEVSSGNLDPLNVDGFNLNNSTNPAPNELYLAWKSLEKVLNLSYGIPNLINDYNVYKELID